MESPRRYDTVVIGNGVIGYSIAYELAKRAGDLKVAVCGPARRGGAASVAAGAMLSAFGEVTKSTLASAQGQAKFDLCRRALDLWPTWMEELKQASGDPELDKSLSMGTTVLFNAKSGMLDNQNFAALQVALQKFDEPYEEIDPRDVVGLRPMPEGRPLRALHMPREGAVNAREILVGLEAAATSVGVVTVDCEIADIVVQDGTARGVKLVDGTVIEAGTVVLAAGAFSGPLLERVFEPGAVPAMFAGRGIAMLTRRAMDPGFEHTVRSPTRAGACGLHVVPMGDGLEYYGATNDVYGLPQETADFGMSQLLMLFAREQLDQRLYFHEIEKWVVGNRPIAVDGFPLIGRTSVDSLVVATATYRDGFHSSPAIAQFVVDDLLGVGSLAEQLPHFVPERAPIEVMTAPEAAKEFVWQVVSGSYEAGVTLPGWHVDAEIFETHYQQAVDRYYSLLETPIALLPEIILSVVFAPDAEDHRLTAYLKAASRRYHA